jgi:outer membrane autotransporter protein
LPVFLDTVSSRRRRTASSLLLGVALAPQLAAGNAALAADPTGDIFSWSGNPNDYTSEAQDWSRIGNWSVATFPASVVPSLEDVVEIGYGPVYVYDGVDALAYSVAIGGEFGVNVGASLTVANGIVHTASTGQTFSNGGEIYADITTSGLIYNVANINGDLVVSEGGYVFQQSEEDRTLWVGDVDNAGTINNMDADWEGDLKSNAFEVKVTYGATWKGDVLTNEGEIKLEGPSSWTGDVVSNDGNIVLDATDSEWHGDVLANTGSVNSKGSWYGSITSNGWLYLSGYVEGDIVNRETDDPDVGALFYAGNLEVGGSIDVEGWFSLRETAGAQIVTAQSLTLAEGSWLEVDIDQHGNADRLDIAGIANIAGSVYVGAAEGDGYVEGTRYTILTAGSIVGGFAEVQSDLSFLTPVLSSDGTSISLVLMRNDFNFADGATAPNDRTAAAAIQQFGTGNPLYEAALNLTDSELPGAFSGLAGDSHLATQSTIVATSQVVGDTMLSHINASFDALATGASASGYAAAPVLDTGAVSASGAWGTLYGVHSEIDADDGLPASATQGGGMVGGVDTTLGDWRVGLMLHAGSETTTLAALDDSSDTTSYGAGLYAGREWGDTRLLLGTAIAGHSISSSRTVSLPEAATLEADYSAGTAMAFAELSHHLDFGAVELTPRLGLSHVRYGDDGFAETGGDAALTGAATDIATTYTTLGLDIARQFALGDGALLTATGSVGWRHAFAETATGEHAFADAPAFTVLGTPQAADTLLLGARLAVDLDTATAIGLDYNGQLADGATAHSLAASWNARF